MDEEWEGIERRRRGIGLLELCILAAVVTVAGAIITLAMVGASAG